MKNPKGLILTIVLVVAPILIFIIMLKGAEEKYPTSGDYVTATNQIDEIVNQNIEEANNNAITFSGDYQSGEYVSSKYGNPISKLIEGAKVAEASVIIYEEPSEDSNTVGSVNKDVPFTAQDYENGWSQIKFDAISGWIKTEHIVKPDDGAKTAIQSAVGKSGSVIVDSLNLRSAATTVGDPIDQLSFGDKFKVLDENADGTWYNIQCGTKNGWIKGDSKFVQIDYDS